MSDRLAIRRWATRGVGLSALVAAGLWALLPLGEALLAAPQIDLGSTSTQEPTPEPTWSDASFSANLWTPPPMPSPEQVTEQSRHRPAPLRLELVGIANAAGGQRIAVLYDPDTDSLLFAAAGEAAGPFRVEDVSATGVVLADGDVTRELQLATGGEGG